MPPVADSPESATCVCGSGDWHRMIDARVLWCARCGCVRIFFASKWKVPLDRVGEMALSTERISEDETPTLPGTPGAKRGER